MSLKKIKELFEQGKYDQVLIHFEELEDPDRLAGSVFKMESIFFKNWIKSDRFKHQDGVLELGEDIIAEAQRKGFVFIEIHACLARCEMLRLNYTSNLLSDPQKGDNFRVQWLEEIKHVEILLQNMKQDSIDPPDEFQASLLQQQGMYFLQLNEFTKAQSYLEKSKKLCEKNQDIYLLANANQLLGWLKQGTNEFKIALNYYEQALTLFQQLPNENEMAIVCHNLAVGYASLGQYDQAIKYNRMQLEIHQKNQNLIQQADAHIWGSWLFSEMEKYDIAYEELKKGKEIAEELNNELYLAFALSHFGAMYIRQDQLDTALEILQKAWSYNQIRWWIAWYLGQIYWLQNRHEQAEEYLLLSLEGDRKINGFRDVTCWIFFEIITVNLELNRKEKAEEHFRTFQNLIEEYKKINKGNPRMEAIYNITKGKMLKESSRMAQKMEAMKIFEQVAQEKDPSVQIRSKIYALFNLCELLLLEYKSLHDETILDDIQTTITQIMKVANENQSHSIITELLLLKFKLALVTKKISEAQQFLEESEKVAQEYNLENLLVRIKQEEREFNSELQEWSNLANQDTPIGEMIQKTKIQTYVNVALGVMEKTLSEKTP